MYPYREMGKVDMLGPCNFKMEGNNCCKVCGVTSNAFCRSCCKVYYCSKEHQKVDWKKHKRQCFPVESFQDETGESERKLVATRDIKQGEVILSERPLLVTPNTRDPDGVTCLGCCSKILLDKAVPCGHCGWALCSIICDKKPLHADNECQTFQENKILPKKKSSYQIYCEIGVLRLLLLKEKCPTAWATLSRLDDFANTRKENPDKIFDIKEIIEFIQNECNMPNLSEEIIDTAFGILRANAFDSSDYNGFVHTATSEVRYASLLFPNALIPGPNCIPNGHYAISGRYYGNYKMCVVAATSILKGESISIPYEEAFSGTFLRREVKKKVFFQSCTCPLCQDPTEFGTYLSSPKCTKCKKGFYIQINPLETAPDWKCMECSSQMPHAYVMDMLQNARYKLLEIMKNPSLEKSVKAIKQLQTSSLSPNHFLILQTEVEVCRRILTSIGLNEINELNLSSNTSLVEILIETSKHLLSVADIVRPGYNRTRGRLLYCLQFGLIFSLLSSNTSIESPCTAEGPKRCRKKKIEECKLAHDEAQSILELEPEDSFEERTMLNTLQSDLQLAITKIR